MTVVDLGLVDNHARLAVDNLVSAGRSHLGSTSCRPPSVTDSVVRFGVGGAASNPKEDRSSTLPSILPLSADQQ